MTNSALKGGISHLGILRFISINFSVGVLRGPTKLGCLTILVAMGEYVREILKISLTFALI